METVTDSSNVTLGQTVITANAADVLDPADVLDAFRRHARGDWGEVSPTTRTENELSRQQGGYLRSAFRDQNGTESWVITEADGSVTNVKLHIS
jgi:hypothetical protein